MNPLQNRIDFCVIISVDGANPNGDPATMSWYPRVLYDGHGEISDVCLKRKIRNRLQDMGEKIFVQEDSRIDDGYRSLKERILNFDDFKNEYRNKKPDFKKIYDSTCKKWIDIRTFGQVFPFKGAGNNLSTNVRGCMSLWGATSLDVIDVQEIISIKSTNLNETEEGRKDSASFFHRYMVHKAAYVTYGSIYCQLAEKNNFTEEDAEKIHQALITLFEGDAAAMRPAGTMNVQKVYWWKHNCKTGQYPQIKVFKTLDIQPQKEYPFFTVTETPLPDLTPEVYTL